MYMDYNMYNNYYGLNDNYRSQNINTKEEIISLTEALELIKISVLNEKEDELFYDMLIEQATSNEAKEIITDIRNDERKHNQILRDIYYKLTGIMLPENMSSENRKNTYEENLVKALFGELAAVKKYRKILGAMPNNDLYTLLMSIMTDELIHASKYNYLIHISAKK